MPPNRRTWTVDVRQDQSPGKTVKVRVERNTGALHTGKAANHHSDVCPVRLAHEETLRVCGKHRHGNQQLHAFRKSISQRIRTLQHAMQSAELESTESEVQAQERFVEQNIVMAHNPGRLNSLHVRVNRQQTLAQPTSQYKADHYGDPIPTTSDQHAGACLSDLKMVAEEVSVTRRSACQALLRCSTQLSSESQPLNPNTAHRLSFSHKESSAAMSVENGLPLVEPAESSDGSTSSSGDERHHIPQTAGGVDILSELCPTHIAAVLPKTSECASRVLVSRRLFMDLERAQVQEARRQKRLQEQVQQVLENREQDRYNMEIMDRLKKGEEDLDPQSEDRLGCLPTAIVTSPGHPRRSRVRKVCECVA